MMDTESPAPAATNPATDRHESIRNLLALARQLIDQGNPSQALHAVVVATKNTGGDEAVVKVMDRARDLYRNKLQTSSAADELASLFAECAIAEAAPSRTEPSQSSTMGQSFEPDAQGSSILSEAGRKQIMLDAFADGSSFVCLQCGGLVGSDRKDEHYAYWCCKI